MNFDRIPDPLTLFTGCALWVPRCVRDTVYRFIAANRYRWFGKHEPDLCHYDARVQRKLLDRQSFAPFENRRLA